MFVNSNSGHTHMIARFTGDPSAVRAGVERAWKTITTEVPFSGEFSDDVILELYEAEDARAKTFAAFALPRGDRRLPGLFGLAAFTRAAHQGDRHPQGAGRQEPGHRPPARLAVLKPVIVANLIAWPVAWWVMRDWLNGFDTRIDLGPTPFLLAGFIALAIAIGTIAGHAMKVARSNPINALRYE
jgi:putative ABC transport system permease protein